jgi:hypothetical protein
MGRVGAGLMVVAGRVFLGRVVVVAVFVFVVSVFVAPALALAGPAWRVTSVAVPTDVAPGGTGAFSVQVENVGDASSVEGSPVTVVDRLPQGMVASQASAYTSEEFIPEPSGLWGECEIGEAGHLVSCTYQAGATIAPVSSSPGGSVGIGPHTLAPPIGIDVSIEPLASGSLTSTVTVSGGGAPGVASDTASLDVSSAIAPFGVSSFHQWSTNIDGTPAVQAGSHPDETTTDLTFNLTPSPPEFVPTGVVRNIHLELPAGFVGNPQAIPKCPRPDFDTRLNGSFNPACPPDTQVGVATVTVVLGFPTQIAVYNLVPPAGVPVQFAAGAEKFVGFIDANVRPIPGGGYGVDIDSSDIQTHGASGVSVSLWGDPGDPSHDKLRFEPGQDSPSAMPSEIGPKPFLSLPTSCGVPQTLTVSTNSWEDPMTVSVPGAASTDEQNNPVTLEGCSKLDFSPSVSVKTGTGAADGPAGLSVDLNVPQNEDPNGLSEADLKNVSVALPAGMTVSPSAANGLEACSEEQLGVTGSESTLLFNEAPAACPAASKVGTVEVVSPLLEHSLQGVLYLAQQNANPFGSLVAVYLVVEGEGVLVKRAGEVQLNQQTGQVTATFLNNPQVPISEIKVDTFQNSRSSLMTPPACGNYTTTTDLTGWNGSTATPSPSEPFPVNSNCSQAFTPAFTAETTNNGAGVFSPFAVAFSRHDGEQRFANISVQTPPGLSGVLKGIQQCPEPQASNATCGPESQIGHALVAVGPGPEPFYVPGNVFLTGPYGGAPFGLDIVARAKAGPFDLGNVVVRARISIDPHTTQITVTPDSGGQFAIPTILKGIPLDMRLANITIDRPGFIFNPTNCSRSSVNGVMTSTSGTTTPVSSPFQATGCSKLPFKPSFTVSTQAHTSKADGASLVVKITKKPGEANLHKADLQLPIALPARLTTLQKACTEGQFNANPAGCPAASVIGTAKLNTPVLSVPVMGPAFLVSHGGAAFPDVEFVLQGEGVTVIVDGATDIKKGITYSKFETAPDQPFTSFETRLPEGPYSVLATDIPTKAKGSLCGQNLTMPTTLTGQNETVLTQTTKITVNGCPKTKKKPVTKPKHTKKSTSKAGGTK